MGEETSIRVQEADRTPPKINENGPMSQHIIVKFTNLRSKETSSKVARGKRLLTYRGRSISIISDLSTGPGKPERPGKTYSWY